MDKFTRLLLNITSTLLDHANQDAAVDDFHSVLDSVAGRACREDYQFTTAQPHDCALKTKSSISLHLGHQSSISFTFITLANHLDTAIAQ